MQAAPSTSTKTTVASGKSTAQLKTPQKLRVDSTNEIEEISKKISEHADAIYRTWKSHGLAPTELLEFYTSAAAVAVAGETSSANNDFFTSNAKTAAVEDTTEGLQKLVNSFVIKDKEQRGVKTANKNVAQRATPMPGEIAVSNAAGTPKATCVSGKATHKSSAILLKQAAANHDKDFVDATTAAMTSSSKKKIARTSATTTSASKMAVLGEGKNSACAKIGDDQKTLKRTPKLEPTAKNTGVGVSVGAANSGVKAKTTALSIKSKTSPSDSIATTLPQALTLDINLNLDLSLDVNNLTQLQAQNLLKIKELLQENRKESGGGATKKTLMPEKDQVKPAVLVGVPTVAATAASPTAKSALQSTSRKIGTKSNIACGSVGAAEKMHAIAAVSAHTTDKNSSDNGGMSGSASSGGRRTSGTKLSNAKLSNENQQPPPQQEPKQLQLHPQSNGSPKKRDEGDVSKTTTPGAVIATTIAAPSTKLTSKVPKTALKESSSDKEDYTRSASSKLVAKEKKDTKTSTVATSSESIMATMPTPTKVVKSGTRSMLNGPDKNLGRPILTRGSVAERVLMFEKCPDVRNSFLNIKRPDPADAPPKSLLKVKLHATPPTPPDQNSIQREFRSTKSVYIPRFYFPHGKPQPQIALERTLRGILSAFDSFPNNQVTKDELPRILKLCGIPFYWRMPVMVFCQQGTTGLVERQRFVEFWKQMNVYCHEAASRFVYILSRGQRFRNYILPEDLAPLVQDVVDTHPGLAFLKEATEFHSRYVHTVIARIFYSVNRSWSGKITIAELKKSDLLEMITLLEEEDDINQIMAFFSYEHFYVIYCKFWELDKDHDLLINQDDLARHSDHALSTRIVERIFSGCVTRGDNKRTPDDEPKMSYTDFVWFLLSEEDKRTPTAIEYWFRCMDVDGDGVLSMYELEYFYEEQQQRMESIGIETLPFEDCLCQMLDMIKPQRRDCVTLGDLKRCKMTHVFFDTFFNLEKYLDHEQRDPFASQRDEYSSDWDRFAAQEYELLITEEND